MSDQLAEMIAAGIGVYFAVGAILAIIFLIFFVGRVDESANGARFFFRPMIFLGCVIIWPILLVRVILGGKINTPTEDPDEQV